jgi:Fic family protein
MHPDMFSDSPAGAVIRVGDGDNAYWAYVPKPLPPKIEPSLDLMQILSESDRALGELAGLGRTMSNPHLLIGPFIRREAVDSSRIEGTRTTLAELYAYEARRRRPADSVSDEAYSDAREVLNYVRALERGIELIGQSPVTIDLICRVHGHLMQDVRGGQARPGCLRDCQVYIGSVPGIQNASYVPPPVQYLNECLENLVRYMGLPDHYPPLVRIALCHYQFEAIHPFRDGNGRIGRLLITLLLIKWGLLSLPLLYLSAFFERRRREYYDCLLGVSQRGAWLEWLQFFLAGVREQSADASARLRRLEDLREEWRKILLARTAPANMLRVMELLFDSPIVTIPGLAEFLGVTHRGASQIVSRLVELTILEEESETAHPRSFVAKRVLDIATQRMGAADK